MKGLIIFDDRSDLAFFSLDREMEKHVFNRMKQLSGTSAEEAIAQRDTRDIVSAFFLPFYTSFCVLNSLKKPVLAIKGEDDFLIVFRKFDDSVYLAVSQDEEDTEESLTRKLFVFNRIVTLLYGPVDSKINPSGVEERKVSWQKLAGLLRTYERLYCADQIFLLEAVEHVQFGQLQAAQDVVVKLAKDCLDQSNNGGLPNVQHAMLLVNTKLLTICGRSPQVATADILLMTLFICRHFLEDPTQDEPPIFDAKVLKMKKTTLKWVVMITGVEADQQTSFSDVGEGDEPNISTNVREQTFPEEMDPTSTADKDEDEESQDDSGETQETDAVFTTPRSTPGPRRVSELEPEFMTPQEFMVDMEDDRSQFKTPVEEEDGEKTAKDGISLIPKPHLSFSHMAWSVVGKGFPARLKYVLSQFHGPNRRQAAGYRYHGYSMDGAPLPPDKAKFMEQMVFLQPHNGHFIPHTLHCLEVYPGIVLVLITELSGGQLAGTICQTLLNLSNVFNSSRNSTTGSQSTYDLLEDAFRRISDFVKRESQATASSALRKCNSSVQNAWYNLKQTGFRAFLDRQGSEKEASSSQYSRLEACGTDLRRKLSKLFEQLYFTPKQQEYDSNAVTSKLLKNFAALKRDYGEFLALKGMLNIPMVSFSLAFPGMVHFALIDRSFDELTTPSLSIDNHVGIPYVEKRAQKSRESAGIFLRRKIWEMVQRAQKFLALGYTSQTWLDEDFLYSYYLWVNIPNNALGTPIRFYAPTNVRASETSHPGVIGSHFYRDLYHGDVHSQGYVYELYCIHQSDIPIKVASSQCKNLAEQLWPLSREAIAPFSLIN